MHRSGLVCSWLDGILEHKHQAMHSALGACLPTCCVPVQAGHALVGSLMPEYDPVTKISIVPRGNAGGLTFFAPSEERLESGLYSR